MKKKLVIMAVLILVMIPLLSGCMPIRIKGGGWIPVYRGLQQDVENHEEIGKANFGFTVEQYETEPDIYETKGNLLYIDHMNAIKIKGKVLGAIYDEGTLSFGGEYTADGETGNFYVIVTDEGEPGDMDTFEIYVEGGLYDGYISSGILGGGNIQILEPDPPPTETPVP